jgi:hypothetical protein
MARSAGKTWPTGRGQQATPQRQQGDAEQAAHRQPRSGNVVAQQQPGDQRGIGDQHQACGRFENGGQTEQLVH